MKRQRWLSLVITLCAISVHAQLGREASHPATIERVSVTGTNGGPNVEVILSQPTVPKVLRLEKPDRLVLEFENTQAGSQPHRIPVDKGGIKEVRIGQDGSTAPITRVVLDLLEPRDYRMVQNDNRITLTVLASMRHPISALPSTHRALQQTEGARGGGIPALNENIDRIDVTPSGIEEKASDEPTQLALSGEGDPTRPPEDPASQNDSRSSVQNFRQESVDPPPRVFNTQAVADKSSVDVQPTPSLLNMLPLQFPTISALLAAPSDGIAAPAQGRPADRSDSQLKIEFSSFQNLLPERSGPEAARDDPRNVRQPEPAIMAAATPNVAARTARPVSKLANAVSKLANDKLATSEDSFVIGPGDVLAISVWKEPDISRSIPVRSDGQISLPLIGEIQASGQTPRQLGVAIASALQVYISEPEVTVIVQEIKSRSYNVLGSVAKPGSYSLSSPVTVLDAIAIAGGFRDFAKKKSMFVLRRTPEGQESRIGFNYNKVIKGKNPEQNVILRPGDTIVVP